jgi:lipoprotein NlpI
MATPTAFDHVVTRATIDGVPYYLDATRINQRGPIERLGWSLIGADGLVLAENTQSLIVISPLLAHSRTNELEETIDIPKLGADAKLSVTQKFYGLGAEAWRGVAKQLTLEQQRRALTGEYEKRYPGLRLEADPVLIDDEAQNMFTVKTKYVIPNLTKEERGDWYFRFFPSNMAGSISVPQDAKRQAPAVLSSYPNALAYSLTVNWPSSVAALRDPFSTRISNEHFSADVQRTFRGNVSTAKVLFENRNNVVTPKQLPALTEDVRRLERQISGVMVAQKDQIKSSGFLGIGKTTIQQTMNSRLDQIIETTSKVIRDKTLDGNDLAEVHCERAIALADRGRALEGLPDAEAAVKLGPSLGRAYYCRLAVNYVAGNFAAVLPDVTKALSLGADANDTISKRGLAKFYLGQFDSAAIDFERAAISTETKKGDGATFLRLWQAWSLLRAGKPLTDELKAQAAKGKTGLWPQPALAMAAGLLPPDELISALNTKQGDDKELSLVEAWFYVGQHFLVKGDSLKAKAAFEDAQKGQISMYIEHVAAGFELSKLR